MGSVRPGRKGRSQQQAEACGSLLGWLARPPAPDPGLTYDPAEEALPGLLAQVAPEDVAYLWSFRDVGDRVTFPVAVSALAAQTYARRGAHLTSPPVRLPSGVSVAPEAAERLRRCAVFYRDGVPVAPVVFAAFLARQVPPVELVALAQRIAAARQGGVWRADPPRRRLRLYRPSLPSLPARVRGVLLAGGLVGCAAAGFAGSLWLVASR